MSTASGAPAEVPLFRLRRQGRVLTLPVLVMLGVAAASGYYVGALPEPWMNLAAACGALALFLLLGVGPLLGWLTNRVTVTNRRVIVRQGFFVHRRSEVPMSRVREVRTRRGPIQRLFGSGDVELLVGPDAPVRLRDVPSPTVVVDALQELIEENYQQTASQPRLGEQGVAGLLNQTTVLPR